MIGWHRLLAKGRPLIVSCGSWWFMGWTTMMNDYTAGLLLCCTLHEHKWVLVNRKQLQHVVTWWVPIMIGACWNQQPGISREIDMQFMTLLPLRTRPARDHSDNWRHSKSDWFIATSFHSRSFERSLGQLMFLWNQVKPEQFQMMRICVCVCVSTPWFVRFTSWFIPWHGMHPRRCAHRRALQKRTCCCISWKNTSLFDWNLINFLRSARSMACWRCRMAKLFPRYLANLHPHKFWFSAAAPLTFGM